jgi:hypothetical protein
MVNLENRERAARALSRWAPDQPLAQLVDIVAAAIDASARRICPVCQRPYADAGDAVHVPAFHGGEGLCWARGECRSAATLTPGVAR